MVDNIKVNRLFVKHCFVHVISVKFDLLNSYKQKNPHLIDEEVGLTYMDLLKRR